MQTRMIRLLCAICMGGLLLFTPFSRAFAVDSPSLPANAVHGLSAEQAQTDVRVLTKALKALHPALTKYRSDEEMQAAFARFEARGNAARTPIAMYMAATELAAAIRCGHTWTNWRNQANPMRTALMDGADKLPMLVTLVQGRWLVLASSDVAVVPGDIVASINGRSDRQLIAEMMPYLRADGSSDGKRLRQLGHDRPDASQMDILLPLLYPPVGGTYALELQKSDGTTTTARVAATTLAARQKSLAVQGFPELQETWRLNIKDGVALLALPTFSFWNSKFDWAAFLEKSFAQIQAQQVKTLVIDIRDNEGGDGAIGNLLLSYLIDKPLGYRASQSVSAYERVPYPLVRYLDTWDYSFFDRTGDVDLIAEGTAKGKYQLRSRPVNEQFIKPGPVRFSGKTYMLVGPENSSATFVLADLAQRSKVVTLVGQPTGGNQRGLNGGQLTWVTLPHSGVAVDIPLLAAHYSETTPDVSVMPDVFVQPSLQARAAGQDQEFQAVSELIARGASK